MFATEGDVLLIACSKKKGPAKSQARDLYRGDLFRKSLAYASCLTDESRIFILSAKYGLVSLEEEIEPYDLSIKSFSAAEKRIWASKVANRLAEVSDLQNDKFVLFAPIDYRKYLLPYLHKYEVPLEGLVQGKQKQRLKS
jgi:cytoplasmic iron level regulating protein YaaA (DUF328/UPF0246 family)